MLGRIWVCFGLIVFSATAVFTCFTDAPIAVKLGWSLLVILCAIYLSTRAVISVVIDSEYIGFMTLKGVRNVSWSDVRKVKRDWSGKAASIQIKGASLFASFGLDYITTKDYWTVIEQIEQHLRVRTRIEN